MNELSRVACSTEKMEMSNLQFLIFFPNYGGESINYITFITVDPSCPTLPNLEPLLTHHSWTSPQTDFRLDDQTPVTKIYFDLKYSPGPGLQKMASNMMTKNTTTPLPMTIYVH